MLHSANQLTGFTIAATDGDLGSIDTVFFDDHKWTIRYFVVDTGRWLSGRKVLISPRSVHSIDWDHQTMLLNLTQQQIENSPGVDADQPVSRQREVELHDHFGYPYYWTGPFVWGATAFPEAVLAGTAEDMQNRERREDTHNSQADADPNLRSCKEVIGYTIQARDDTIGHVEDFLFDEASWTIQLIVIDPRNWWPGKHVMVAPERINRIEWVDQTMEVGLTRDEVENSPEYDASNPPPSRQPPGSQGYAGGTGPG